MNKTIEFHFKGGIADNQQLPVDLMINLLNNIKDLTYLILAQQNGIIFNERFKPSKKITQDYIIKCEIPEKGSYQQAISVEYKGEPTLLQGNPVDEIIETLQYIVDKDEPNIIRLFPNPKMRLRALSCLRNAFPQVDSEISTDIIGKENSISINSLTIQNNITSIFDNTKNIVEEFMTVITGYLSSIDFNEKKICIIHPVTKKLLDCYYNEEIEDMLFSNRRQLVQVVGQVMADEDSYPKKITDVVSIQEIDLSPIKLDSVIYNNTILHFKNSLILEPKLDDTQQLYIVNYPELGLDVFAYTRQEILEDIKSDIFYLWNEYGKANDDELSDDALDLKKKIKDFISEEKNDQ